MKDCAGEGEADSRLRQASKLLALGALRATAKHEEPRKEQPEKPGSELELGACVSRV